MLLAVRVATATMTMSAPLIAALVVDATGAAMPVTQNLKVTLIGVITTTSKFS
jgi:hypothetical protein